MISYYKTNGNGIMQIQQPCEGCWIKVIDPTPEEITILQGCNIPTDYIHYPLDMDERPRTERENGDVLIVLRIPYFQGETADVPFGTLPLGIILSSQYVVTVCKIEHELLADLASGKVRDLSTHKRNRFVLRLLLLTAGKYLAYLRRINQVVDKLEDELQQSTRNRELLELLKYQKSLTYFTTALKSNELMMERLQRSQIFKMYEEDEDLLDDVLTENQQAIEMTNISANILSQMMDAFASIISNNLNVVMKILASITIVLSLPTMIASFYGMNVELPFGHSPTAFALLVGFAFALSLGTVWFFYKRDWL